MVFLFLAGIFTGLSIHTFLQNDVHTMNEYALLAILMTQMGLLFKLEYSEKAFKLFHKIRYYGTSEENNNCENFHDCEKVNNNSHKKNNPKSKSKN